MPEDPEALGSSLGTLLADFIPLLPSGARRAGAAKVMAARVGHDPSFLVDHPIKTQLLALGLGGATAPFTQGQSAGVRAAGAVGPVALVQFLRHMELKKIQRKYDSEKRKRLSELDQEELFDNGMLGLGGSSRLGAVSAYETMRERKYKGYGSLAEAGDALQLAMGAVNPAFYSGSIPLIAGIDNHAADKLMSKAAEEKPGDIASIAARAASSGLGGGVIGALGTSGILAAAALVAQKRFPGLGNLLRGAAKDGLTVFDPRRAYKLIKAMPEGLRLFQHESDLLRAAESFAARGSGRIGGAELGLAQNLDFKAIQKDLGQFKAKHKMSPYELAQELAGSISGVASAGAGAAVATASSLGGDVRHKIKKADFADQNNSPSLPLYLAAAALSSAGLGAASAWAHREGGDTPALGPGKWSGMVGDISDTAPLLLGTEGTGNAFFYKPQNAHEAAQFLRQTDGLRDHTANPISQFAKSLVDAKAKRMGTGSITGDHDAKVRRLQQFGVIVADSNAGAPTIAHEAGHAKIEATPGVLRALQRHVYPHAKWLAPLAGAGSMAAGLASGSAGKGALIGTGIGALAGMGMVGPEAGASYHALKHLKSLGDGSLNAEGKKDLISALSTYLAATVLPSTLSGAAGGWISGRRRKKEEDEEGVEKAAAKWDKLVQAGKLGGYDLARILSASGVKDVVPSRAATRTAVTAAGPTAPWALTPQRGGKGTSGGAANALWAKAMQQGKGGFSGASAEAWGRKIETAWIDSDYVAHRGKTGIEPGAQKAWNNLSLDPTVSMNGELIPTAVPTALTLGRVRRGLGHTSLPTSSTELLEKSRSVYDASARATPNEFRSMARVNKAAPEDYHFVPGFSEFYAHKNDRKLKKLWGRYSDDSNNYKDMSQFVASGGNAFFAAPLRGLSVPRNAPRIVGRHEVAHGMHVVAPDTYRRQSVADLFMTARRAPHLERALLRNPSLGREAIAQSIASRGGSRSAQRFAKDYADYGRSNYWPKPTGASGRKAFHALLDGAQRRDPSGTTEAILTQLHKNYRVPVPMPGLPLRKQASPHAALPDLLQAKAHSDNKDYRQKGLIVRSMMDKHPEDWVVDSDDGEGILGVTHKPTGFRLHMKKQKVAPGILTP